MTRALIADVSEYNGPVNYVKMKANGVSAVLIRASWLYYEDKMFKANRDGAKAAGLPRFFYHYLDWRGSEITQANYFNSLIASDKGELPPVMDLEMDATAYSYTRKTPNGLEYNDLMPITRKALSHKSLKYYLPKSFLNTTLTPSQVQTKAQNFLNIIEKGTGKIPHIYSGYYYWLQWMNSNPSWVKYPFWLAWYAAENYIKVPPPWTRWTFWQYTSNGNGPYYGSTGLSLDLNWFNGTVVDLQNYINQTPVPDNYVVCPNCGFRFNPNVSYPAYKVNPNTLANIRETDSLTGKIIGQLGAGNIVFVNNLNGNDGYYHFVPTTTFLNGGWIHSSLVTKV